MKSSLLDIISFQIEKGLSKAESRARPINSAKITIIKRSTTKSRKAKARLRHRNKPKFRKKQRSINQKKKSNLNINIFCSSLNSNIIQHVNMPSAITKESDSNLNRCFTNKIKFIKQQQSKSPPSSLISSKFSKSPNIKKDKPSFSFSKSISFVYNPLNFQLEETFDCTFCALNTSSVCKMSFVHCGHNFCYECLSIFYRWVLDQNTMISKYLFIVKRSNRDRDSAHNSNAIAYLISRTKMKCFTTSLSTNEYYVELKCPILNCKEFASESILDSIFSNYYEKHLKRILKYCESVFSVVDCNQSNTYYNLKDTEIDQTEKENNDSDMQMILKENVNTLKKLNRSTRVIEDFVESELSFTKNKFAGLISNNIKGLIKSELNSAAKKCFVCNSNVLFTELSLNYNKCLNCLSRICKYCYHVYDTSHFNFRNPNRCKIYLRKKDEINDSDVEENSFQDFVFRCGITFIKYLVGFIIVFIGVVILVNREVDRVLGSRSAIWLVRMAAKIVFMIVWICLFFYSLLFFSVLNFYIIN